MDRGLNISLAVGQEGGGNRLREYRETQAEREMRFFYRSFSSAEIVTCTIAVST